MNDKSKESKPAVMPTATTKAAATVKPRAATSARAKPVAKPVVQPSPVKSPVRKTVNKPAPSVSIVKPKPAARPVRTPAAATKPVVKKAPVLKAVPAKKKTAAETKAELARAAQAMLTLGLADTKPAKPAKSRKAKLVRDSFTMPETEYSRIAVLKKRLLLRGRETKKSELLRAGLAMLAGLDDAKLLAEMSKIERIRTGRPPKSK